MTTTNDMAAGRTAGAIDTGVHPVLATAADASAILGGGPLILAEAQLPDLPVLARCGALLVRVQMFPDRVVLRTGLTGQGTTPLQPLDRPPAGVLAMIARNPGALRRLPDWWAQAGLPRPNLVVADGALAALPLLLRAALAEAVEAKARLARAEPQAGAPDSAEGAALPGETPRPHRIRIEVAEPIAAPEPPPPPEPLPAPVAPAAPPPPPIAAPPVFLTGPARFETLARDATEAGHGWAILDFRLTGLQRGDAVWREVKMKLGIAGPNVTLEFRRRADWPQVFDAWPGRESDAYGDKFTIVAAPDRAYGLESVAPGRDAALIAALSEVLERAVAGVAPPGDPSGFAAAARRMAACLAGAAPATGA